MLKYQTKNNIQKMVKINRKTFWEYYSLKQNKLCITSTEKYFSTMDRYICPTFLQTSCVKLLQIPT